ncbi:MAG: hypothetical protein NTW87_16945 [Planctomycetota bacterium]|nr:hypothetical protein [Planctomycetota bacterium]
MTESIKELAERYRSAAIGAANPDPKKANECYATVHACYKMLCASEGGRDAILSLMNDDEPGVRCAAASHSLQWRADVAQQVLEALRDSKGPFSFTSEMVLEEYRKGRLKFDY